MTIDEHDFVERLSFICSDAQVIIDKCVGATSGGSLVKANISAIKSIATRLSELEACQVDGKDPTSVHEMLIDAAGEKVIIATRLAVGIPAPIVYNR
jgi:hypothetical protein